jgi:hypothetical protein
MKVNKYLDKILIIAFLFIIFLPNIKLFQKTDTAKINILLNREPYSFPVIHFKELGLTDFSAIEKWYTDKIILVTQLSHIWSNINYKLGISTKPGQAIIGKNNWLFLGNNYNATIDQYTGKNIPDEKELSQLLRDFKQMNKVANQHKTPFLVVVAPDKQDIYPEYLPDYIGKRSNKTRLDMISKLLTKQGINFIDLRNAEAVAKERFSKNHGDTYMAGDSHWNYLGAYGAYEAIANYSKEKFNVIMNTHVISFNANTTTNTDLAGFLQLDNIVSNYPLPDLSKLKIDLIGKDIRGNIRKMSPLEGNGNDLIIKEPYENINRMITNKDTVLLISDSFSNTLGFYFHNDFYNTIRTHIVNKSFSLSKLIVKYHPKMIVFEIVERELIYYSNDFNSKEHK